jgi:digeranylgeranylglycerophospholipid reductase
MTYDICIVGGGLAGLYAAMRCARHGLNVCVVERRTQLGTPVRCAEATGNRAELSRFVTPEADWIATDIDALQLHLDDHAPLTVRSPHIGLMLHRDRFERMLAERARAHGCSILLDTTFTGFSRCGTRIDGIHTHRGDTIKARIIIGADGPESKVGRLAGITAALHPRDIYPAAQYRLHTDRFSDKSLHFFYGATTIRQGYIWVFPKQDGTANVGAGFFGARPEHVRATLDAYIAARFPGVSPGRCVAGCAPITPCPPTLHRDNVTLVGDAARQVNPLICAGIMNALEAAHLCTTHCIAAAGATHPRQHLAAYSRTWRTHQRRQQLFFESIKHMLLASSPGQVAHLLGHSYRFFAHTVDRSQPLRIPLWPTLRYILSVLPHYLPHARHLLR